MHTSGYLQDNLLIQLFRDFLYFQLRMTQPVYQFIELDLSKLNKRKMDFKQSLQHKQGPFKESKYCEIYWQIIITQKRSYKLRYSKCKYDWIMKVNEEKSRNHNIRWISSWRAFLTLCIQIFPKFTEDSRCPRIKITQRYSKKWGLQELIPRLWRRN